MAVPWTTRLLATEGANRKPPYRPLSDREVRVGIVGYGLGRFGAKPGFQDHPNVEVVAVGDLIPERRNGLMQACR